MFSYLDCLLSKLNQIDAQMIGSEKPHQLTSVGDLVFMASPTLACDGPREDSNVASLDQETRVGEQMVGSDITTISTFTRLGHSDFTVLLYYYCMLYSKGNWPSHFMQRLWAYSHQESPLVRSLWSGPKYNVYFLVWCGSFSHCNFRDSPRI